MYRQQIHISESNSVRLQINTHTMLDKDHKSNLVKDSLPSIIRSSRTLKAVSVQFLDKTVHFWPKYLSVYCATEMRGKT